MKHNNFSKPLVSVVVITYNSSKYVIETLESVKNLTYQNIELIISDDQSSDDTVKICTHWLHENGNRFKATKLVVSDTNTGIAPNCNRGLHSSTGEWIKIIAGDDALEPDIISEYISFSEQNENVSALFSRVKVYQNHFLPENIINAKTYSSNRFNSTESTAQEQFEILLRHNCINASTVMIKRVVLEKAGGFDEEFPFVEDWPMWLLLTKAGYKMHYVDIVGVKYRMHAQSVQSIRSKAYKSEVDIAVDRMYKKYIAHLPLFERWARLVIVYRNSVLSRLFGNKSNFIVITLSKIIGAVPFYIIKIYRKRFFGNV